MIADLTEELILGLNVALNEAELLGCEVDPHARVAALTFNVLTLPPDGPAPSDRRVSIRLSPVGRVVASLRNAPWDDITAQPVPVQLQDLLPTVQSFGGLSIYGWEFIDVHEVELAKWGHRLSLDWSSGNGGRAHSLTIFQDGTTRVLDLCIWFDKIEVFTPEYDPLALADFVAGGKRWWDGLYSGDPRAQGFGIYPGRPPDKQ